MKINIFTTGGTIDKTYATNKGTVNFSFGDPAIKELFDKKLKVGFTFNIKNILSKDSTEMTDEDRILVKKACEKSDVSKILITHGTDTMIDTAKVLAGIKDKIIILTGSSLPYIFKDSDADFNIGVAIGALNVLENGVYIAMNGRIFPWNKCQKTQDGRFIEL